MEGEKDEADIDAKEAEVAEFVQQLTAAEKAAVAAAAKKTKGKKGGRQTLRKERGGRKTPRA